MTPVPDLDSIYEALWVLNELEKVAHSYLTENAPEQNITSLWCHLNLELQSHVGLLCITTEAHWVTMRPETSIATEHQTSLGGRSANTTKSSRIGMVHVIAPPQIVATHTLAQFIVR